MSRLTDLLDLRWNLATSRVISRDEQAMLSDGGVAIATPKEETGIDCSGDEPGLVGILLESSLLKERVYGTFVLW